ncbi:Gfo/Idh/MocA family oxidoreductase [Litoribacter alkaliphilus]|uniref:Gfo/Idh/MocA family oxidoreductase n=1 Tax=Litoribacter ruber TaxID=702568 RepID=A0AAP2CG31_9BACT|nr:Gfo/Idh/MocA family oxidoreductase [Litoribacter alkaliphilus]MBS9522924.1 Gfo/Idh/MocA family oxidoreductase [Litoribacter alkaliphilus]
MKRRNFLHNTMLSTSALTLASFPLIWPTSKKNPKHNNEDKVGVALVGLGGYSKNQLAPALEQTEHCYLAGIVTGSPEKIPEWQKKYNIPDGNVYNYENMDDIANNDDIDVIYIVLPSGMHAEYAIKAANTGKHVWCEKPMAKTVEECQSIIDACNKNNVKLTIGYRMQHEPNTQNFKKWVEERKFGEVKMIEAMAGFYSSRTGHWRLDKEMGGGALYDMGVYSINAARYVLQQEPISVMAYESTTRPEIFTEVDETMNFILEFPDGVMANCATSFGINMNRLIVTAQDGHFRMEPFQSYNGLKGFSSDGSQFSDKIKNQQAKQMDNDALAIKENKEVLVPGEEGLKDIKVVEAIFKSAEEGRRVKI